MQDIRRVLQRAGRRLLVVRLFESWAWTITFAIAAVVLVIVVDRALALGLGESSWRSLPTMVWVGIGSLVLALGAGAVWSLLTRLREAGVARVVDERAGLRESLSTALCVERESDPWSRAVVESAADKAKRVVVRDAIPIDGPRAWRVPTGAIVVLILTFFLMPPLDLRGKRADAQAAADARQEIEAAVQDARDTEAQIREIMQRTGLGEDENAPDAELDADLTKPKTPEDIRKQAIRKLTDLNEKLGKQMQSDEAKSLEAVKDLMRRLTTPGQGELSEFARQLSRGNFDKARQELESLNQKLQNGELSQEQKEKLTEQMKNLAEQMQNLSEQQGALEQALQQAGVSPEQAKQLASNPQAMQQALEKNKNLNDAQKQQLQQMANAMQQAASQCQGMSQAMSQMASSMSQQSGEGGQEAMDAMSGQLSAMEQMQAEMQGISDAMGQCQSQMAALGECSGGSGSGWAQGANKPGMTGKFSEGSSMSMGSGSGGPGKGNGAGPDAESADFFFKGEKANVQNQGGAVIASRYVFEEQVKGEARAEFSAAIEMAAEQAAEEIANMNVDPQFRSAVKHYYGRLGERVKAERATTPPAKEDSTENETAGDGEG
ncbi:MAG: hypothetical protein Q9O74_04210 [Planctomycetota bacterium]|nr:hypothetical protein [Planctomycetota bacterium]